MRPRRSWSFGRTLFVYAFRAVADLQFHIGTFPPPNPMDQALHAAQLGFVWVEPVAGDLIVGEIATMADTNHVRPTRVSGYWYGKKDAAGAHGQHADAGECIMYYIHGEDYSNNAQASTLTLSWQAVVFLYEFTSALLHIY